MFACMFTEPNRTRLARLENGLKNMVGSSNHGQHLRGYTAQTDDTTPSLSVSTSIGNQGGGEARPRNVAMLDIIKT